jgi:excisionase family DNA binding protein
MIEPEHYTTDEAATLLRITASGVTKRIQRGELPAVRVGRRWLIPRATLDAMLHPSQAPQGQL